MSDLNYEIFLALHSNKNKNNFELEKEMIDFAKEKYTNNFNKMVEKNKFEEININNYVTNELIKESTIKLMNFCEENFKYKNSFINKFLNDFKKISNSNNKYLNHINSISSEKFELKNFKETDFLRLTEIYISELNSLLYLNFEKNKKNTIIIENDDNNTVALKKSALVNNIARRIKDELLLNDFLSVEKNKFIIEKKLKDYKFSSYEHFKTSLIYIFNKIDNIEVKTNYEFSEIMKISDAFLDFFLSINSNIFGYINKKINKKSKNENSYVFVQEIYIKKMINLKSDYIDTLISNKPILVKPKRFTNCLNGGFHFRENKLIKTTYKQNKFISDNFDLTEIYNAVNALQETKFKINKKMHKVIYDLVFKYKNEIIPNINKFNLESIQRHQILDKNFEDLNENDKKKYNEEKKDFKEKKAEMHNKIVSETSKIFFIKNLLNVSAEFYDTPFYFVYDLDTRGRYYAKSDFLNPLSNDYSKSLLEFSEGQKMTEQGIYQYKLHIANVFAIDKIDKKTDKEKIEWVEKNKEKLLNCAKDCYTNTFWQNADSPFLGLASCFEFEKICRFGTEYISYSYISIDGSCNGLQHYSALRLSSKNAKLTNLDNNEKSEDIYQYIADKVNKKIFDISEKLNQEETEYIRKIQMYDINRKMMKKPVMTTPYSSTPISWKNQIIDEVINEKIYKGEEDYFKNNREKHKAVMFFSTKILKEILETEISSAFETMEIIKKHVSRINEINNKADFNYLTKTGFFVTNFYKENDLSIKINYKFLKKVKTIYFSKKSKNNAIKKLLQAICPNFIHSIDASHMTKTINNSVKQNIKDFVMIHDSFGCHPNQMYNLKRIVRESFVEIYKDNLLYDFLKQLYETNNIDFDEKELKEDTKRYDFDLINVLYSQFSFN